jgi:tetratricopeptide (TPR) repeat protein
MKALSFAVLVLAACASTGADAEALYVRAQRDADAGRPAEEVLPLLDRSIELDPSRAGAWFARGEIHRALRRPQPAAVDFGAAISILRGDPSRSGELMTALLARGRLHAETGRLPAAEADFSEAIRLSSAPIEARLERARVGLRLGRAEQAERDLAEARRLGAGAAGVFHDEGVHQLQAQRPDEAERMFLLALDLDPGHLPASVGLARVWMARGRFAEAEGSLDRAVRLRPGDPELVYHRGNARLAQGKFEEALEDFTRVAERDPRHAGAYAGRGLVYHRHRGDLERAEAEYCRALVADPALSSALVNRASLYRESGRLDEAEQDLRRALSLRADADALQALGRLLLERGDRERAADAFRRSLEICRDPARRKAVEEDLARALRPKE